MSLVVTFLMMKEKFPIEANDEADIDHSGNW